MLGCIGPHIEANAIGYTRARSIAAAKKIGGKYATIVNDPLLCAELLSVGIIPIYRVNKGGFLDDDAHNKGYSARDYIRFANSELEDKTALISFVNEPGRQNLTVLRDFLLEGIDEANNLGRKLVLGNWSYGNPEPEDWDVLAPVLREMSDGKHILGVHEGYDIEHPNLDKTYPYLIGRFLEIKKKYNLSVIVTEFAANKTAWDGWQTWLGWQTWASKVEDAVKNVYSPNGVYITPFTLYPWQTGFDYINQIELQEEFNRINERNPMDKFIPEPTAGGKKAKVSKMPGKFINLRSQPEGTDIGDILKDQTVTVFLLDNPVNGWVFVKTDQGPSGWVSLQNGAVDFGIIEENIIISPDLYAELLDAYSALGKIITAIERQS